MADSREVQLCEAEKPLPTGRPHVAATTTPASRRAVSTAGRPESASSRRTATQEQHQELAQTLRRKMAPEGYVGSHQPAPDAKLPPSFIASLQRRHAALNDVSMVPATLRAWEASIMQDEAVRRKLGVSQLFDPPSSRALPAAARLPPPPQGAAPFSQHEMRRFLRHAQQYFLSVDPKQPSAVPRTGRHAARTTYDPPA